MSLPVISLPCKLVRGQCDECKRVAAANALTQHGQTCLQAWHAHLSSKQGPGLPGPLGPSNVPLQHLHPLVRPACPVELQLVEIAQSTRTADLAYIFKQWGWAEGTQELQQEAQHTRLLISSTDPSSTHSSRQHLASTTSAHHDSPAAGSSLAQLISGSRAACAPHCAAELAQQLGLADTCQSLAVSTLHVLPSDVQLDSLREAAKQHINASWSHEAVKQGVSHAKQAQYSEARRCYDKALELQADNVDAYVARGAALANESQYTAAAADLKHALHLDPSNANAARYLAAVKSRAEKEGVSLEPPPVRPAHAQPAPPVVSTPAIEPAAGNQQAVQRHADNPSTSKRRQSEGQQDGPRSISNSSDDGSSDSSSSGESGGAVPAGNTIKAALHAVLKARRSSKSKKHKHKSGSKRKKSRDRKSGSKKKRRKK